MEQLRKDMKLLIYNNINFNMWNEIFENYIGLLLSGRLSQQEIQSYSTILLNSFPICMTNIEESFVILQKEKLKRGLELIPNNNTKVTFSDYTSQIKKVKDILCKDISLEILRREQEEKIKRQLMLYRSKRPSKKTVRRIMN